MKLHPDCLDCALEGTRCYTCRVSRSHVASKRALRYWGRHLNRAFAHRLDEALGPLKTD